MVLMASKDNARTVAVSVLEGRTGTERNNYGGGPFRDGEPMLPMSAFFFFGADVVDAASFLLLRLTKRSEAPFACFFFARPNRFGFTCHCTAIIVGEHTSTSLLSSVCQKAMKMKEDDDEDDDDENYEHGAKRNETCTLH